MFVFPLKLLSPVIEKKKLSPQLSVSDSDVLIDEKEEGETVKQKIERGRQKETRERERWGKIGQSGLLSTCARRSCITPGLF